ncbi:MAG: hypothetical protein QNJ63_09230 [Calothrix sp. MO_192.B10]|nr:hypothetical protein [Calothrix sp. MO_192.B10]
MSNNSYRHFKKENPWRWKPVGEQPLDSPLTIRLTKEKKEQIKKVPGWQGLLRAYIDELIKSNIDGT